MHTLQINVDNRMHALYIAIMSKRLLGKIREFQAKEKAAIAKLAVAVEKDPVTVRRWLNANRIPDSHDRFKIALACGCSEAEAVELALDTPIAKVG